MDLLNLLVSFFTDHGYFAVILVLLICSLGVPLPEDITLVAGGIIAGLDYANVHIMLACAMFGVLGGDLIMFSLGHHFGDRILNWWLIKRLVTPERYAKVQDQFERYGNRMLFVARFLPGMRAAVFVTAGLSHRVSVWMFLLIDGFAAAISVPVWVYLGYFGANNTEWMMTWIHRGQASLWVLLAVVLLGFGGYWWYRRRKRKAASPED